MKTNSHPKKTNKSIGLFGASFNPPHNGHLAVLSDLAKLSIFDEIWAVPVFSHAFGKKLESFEHRLNMLKLLLAEIPIHKIHISTIEQELNKSPTYTFDVVSALKERHPDIEFHLIVGSDIKNELDKWHRIQELRNISPFYFIAREGYEHSKYPEVSSSDIRDKITQHANITHLVPAKIAEYIQIHHLYQ